jgi:fructan beta-fructosidase
MSVGAIQVKKICRRRISKNHHLLTIIHHSSFSIHPKKPTFVPINAHIMRSFCFFFALTFCLCSGCSPKQAMPKRDLLTEPHRPKFHFTPQKAWMNDPNGMVFFEGEYHLFYQFYPDSTVWGPMHWAHAVSTDLVHWQDLPIALYPDELGYIFSGSAVVDWNNTSGFGKNGKPPLVAMFTHHKAEWEAAKRNDFQYQSIAYSNDKGRTWTKYKGNPVIGNPTSIRDFRDTKVTWHEPSKKWVMALAAGDHLRIYNSPNLKDWAMQSEFGKGLGAHGGLWECPDLFPIKIEGTQTEKWVLLENMNPGAANGGSGTQYFIGEFDGKQFVVDKDVEAQLPLWLDYGRDNYAGVTYSDIPDRDGRRIFIGWMSNWDYAMVVPTQNWRSAMTVPRTLALRNTAKGLRLCSEPVVELQKLRSNPLTINYPALKGAQKVATNAATCEVELEVEFPLDVARSSVGIELKNSKGDVYRVGYDASTNRYFSDRRRAGKSDFSDKFAQRVHYAPSLNKSNTIKMHFLFDRASCELFADGGEAVLTDIYFPTEDFSEIKVFSEGGVARVKGMAWGL